MERVSVVIAAYNAARYIGETLESILAQDYGDFEVVVVDDASSDDTGTVVRRFPRERVRLLRLPENSGFLGKTRNVGIRAATGQVIASCDADDLLTPGSLSARMALLRKAPRLGLVFTDGIRFHDDGREEPQTALQRYGLFESVPRTRVGDRQWVITSADAYHGLAVGNYITTSGILYPRSVFDEIGFLDETLRNGDDLEFCFRVARRYDIGYADVIGFRYRVHTGSISTRGASLAASRLRVLEKQLALDLAPQTRREIRRWIADNYLGLAWVARSEGRMSDARGHALRSLSARPTWDGVRGFLLALLGGRVFSRLRRLRS